VLNGGHGFELLKAEVTGVLMPVVGAMATEDIRDLE
jgi:hypothetical protein